MKRELTRTGTITPQLPAADEQNPHQGLALTDVEQLLYTASSGDTARLERALFGQQVADIGLHPDVLVVNHIQDEVIRAVFELVTRAVKEGRRDEVVGSVRYLLHEIGEKVVVVLAQAKQYHQGSRRTLEVGRKWWQFKGKIEGRHEADCARIDEVADTISGCREDLMSALYESFLPDVDDTADARMIGDFVFLRSRLLELHKKIVAAKTETRYETLSDIADEVGRIFVAIISLGTGFNRDFDIDKTTMDNYMRSAHHAETDLADAVAYLLTMFQILDLNLSKLLATWDEKVQKQLGPRVQAYLNNTGAADSR